MNKIKRFLSMALAVITLVMAIPIGDFVALAADDKKITEITIRRHFKDEKINEVERTQIRVTGKNFTKDENLVVLIGGKEEILKPIEETSNNTTLIYELDGAVTEINILGKTFKIGDMANISSLTPGNIVNSSDKLIIKGSNLPKGEEKNKIYFYGPDDLPENTGVEYGENLEEGKIITKEFNNTTQSGYYRVEINSESIIPSENDSDKVKLTVVNNYPKMFSLRGRLNISEDLYMKPNRGRKNSIVEISGSQLMENMSVFFLPKGKTQIYNKKYRAKKVRFIKGEGTQKDKFIVEVPNIDIGQYDVVITNDVNDINKEDLTNDIKNVNKFKNNTFRVIQAENSMSIENVKDSNAPITGKDVILMGKNIYTIPKTIFTPKSGVSIKESFGKLGGEAINIVKESETSDENSIGTYEEIDIDDKGSKLEIYKVDRKISIQIGNLVKFNKVPKSEHNFDNFDIAVQPITLENNDNGERDVIAEAETKLYFDNSNPKYQSIIPDGYDDEVNKKGAYISVYEEATWDKKFQFEVDHYNPIIEKMIPEKLPVDNSYILYNDYNIYIEGKDFIKHTYKSEGEIQKTKMPTLNFGNQFIIDPNIKEVIKGKDINGKDIVPRYPTNKFIMLDSQGREIDGKNKDKFSTKIIVELPKDKIKIAKEAIGRNELKIINPMINDIDIIPGDEPGPDFSNSNDPSAGGSSILPFDFIQVSESEKPRIDKVNPSLITTEGHKGVVLEGNGFKGSKVYLEGEELKSYKLESMNKIIFDAPPKPEQMVPEQDYEILVQNEDGSIGINQIKYVKSETDLKIFDFNPKKGTKDMWITVTGQDFVKPKNYYIDDTTNEYRLIGTRVFLGDKDVNEYITRTDPATGKSKIVLEDYKLTEELFYLEDLNINAVDYIDALILELEDEKEYYSIDRLLNEGYVISNSGSTIIKIENDKGSIRANVNGKTHDIKYNLGSNIFQIDDLKFEVKTPYKKNKSGKIIGKNVYIKDNGELEFKTPELEDGEYKVTLKNPDGTEDSMEFFKYGKDPVSNPKIETISPNQGPTTGGNIVTITAKNTGRLSDRFYEDTEVSFGMKKIDKIEYIDPYTIKVIVPPYEGELDSGRRSVTVTVQNGLGGSSLKSGYTYIKPGEKPQISGVDPKKGPPAGNQKITVFGKGFKYNESEGYDLNGNGKIDDLETGKIYIPSGNSGEEKQIESLTDEEWEKYILPILPKVYFGREEAEWDFNKKIIDPEKLFLITPKSDVDGDVEVVIENNDFGRSVEKILYKYIGVKPLIKSIDPKKSGTDGGKPIGISGENLMLSDMPILDESKSVKIKKMPRVQFGKLDESDKFTSIKQKSIIDDESVEIQIEDLTIEYRKEKKSDKAKIILKVLRNGVNYQLDYDSYDDNELFIPLKLLKEEGDKQLNITELVRIERIEEKNKNDKLKVERGFSEQVEGNTESHIKAILPYYFSQGLIDIRIINPDGAEDIKRNIFEYKAGITDVFITDILNREGIGTSENNRTIDVVYSVKDKVTIVGTGFTNPVSKITLINTNEDGDTKEIIIGSMLEYNDKTNPTNITVNFAETFFELEDVNSEYEIQVTNKNDDGSAFSGNKRIRVVLPGKLKIESLTPNKGPTSGGTEVTINGEGFVEEDGGLLEVFFGTEKAEVISIESSKKIIVKTPSNKPGLKDVFVKIKYPKESGKSDESAAHYDSFTYISDPVISKIVDPENENRLINNLSIDGGELIKIKGSDFENGAKVIFNPQLRLLGENETEASIDGEIVVINGKRFELNYDEKQEVKDKKQGDGEGQDTYVEFIDGQNLIVKTPKGEVGDKGVIVINPDGAVSNLYNIEFGIPEIGAPMDVIAELVYDQFIRVTWSGVSAAKEYEIYVSIEGGAYEFVGTTAETSFAYEMIKPRTKYKFMIKAIGDYGSSKPLEESISNSVTTGSTAGPEDADGELGENTVVDRQGENADITIGRRDFGSQGYTIDLTRGELAGAKNITIRMPAEIIGGYNSGEIRVIASDYSMRFNPTVFKNTMIEQNRNNTKAGVVFNVNQYNGGKGSASGKVIASQIYDLKAQVFIDKNMTSVDRLAGGIDLVLDQNPMVTQTRRLKNLALSRYYESNNTWINTMRIDRMALYAITGSRR